MSNWLTVFSMQQIQQFIQQVKDYEFLQKALTTSVIVGVIAGILGCFIILRGLALMGDAISHAILPGVAISYMMGTNFFIGAAITGFITALLIGLVQQSSRIKSDAAIGIVFSSFFAIGVILIQMAQSATDLTEILFGNILTVQDSDRNITMVIGVIVIILVVAFYKELLITTFDPTMAAAWGYPTKLIHYGIMVTLTLVTVASLQAVGAILVVALLITPASTAYLLTNNLRNMLILSAIFGVISSVVGLYISFVINVPSGAAIVLCATVMFVLAFLFAPNNGYVWRLAHKLSK